MYLIQYHGPLPFEFCTETLLMLMNILRFIDKQNSKLCEPSRYPDKVLFPSQVYCINRGYLPSSDFILKLIF